MVLTFIANHFTGDNLLDCDQKILQEMGIKKVGDRVRIYVAVKQLRNRALTYRKKKNRVRLSLLLFGLLHITNLPG